MKAGNLVNMKKMSFFKIAGRALKIKDRASSERPEDVCLAIGISGGKMKYSFLSLFLCDFCNEKKVSGTNK